MKNRTESELLHMAAAYCSVGERCIADVRKKITNAGASQESAIRIIERLIKDKFIDESRYCQSFVKDKFRFNRWGKKRIIYELQKKGIPSHQIYEAIDTIHEEEYESDLYELLMHKKQTIKSKTEQELFHKLYRYGINKGFENKLVVTCLKKLLKDIPDVVE